MHRPENTLPAFRHAAALGVEVLEFDMAMTADDRLVVYHDANINPSLCIAVDGAGHGVEAIPVRALTVSQVQRFDCGTRVRGIYDVPGYRPMPGARIPTVEELLGEFADSDVTFYAETKVPRSRDGIPDIDTTLFAAKIDRLVRRFGLEDRFILQSSDYRTIDALHAINPRITTCLLGAHKWDHREFLATLRKHNAGCILVRDNIASAEEIRHLQEAGILVYSGVIDSEEQWEHYVRLGVDVIFTNHPEGAIRYLRSIGLRD